MNKDELIFKLLLNMTFENLEGVIDYLVNNLKLFDNNLFNNLLQICNNFESAKTDYSSGNDAEKWQLAKDKTINNLLDTLDDLPENLIYPEFFDENSPKEAPRSEDKKPMQSNSHKQMIVKLLSEYKTKLILESDPKKKMATELEIERLEKLLEEI